jgi:hypothetical protein
VTKTAECNSLASAALTAMPRFYIDVRDPRSAVADDEGLELPDLDTACKEATAAGAQMVKDLVPCEQAEVTLSVRDENGRPACKVRLAVQVTRYRTVENACGNDWAMDRGAPQMMASDDGMGSPAVSLVLADLRSLGCELGPDAVKRLRQVIAEDPERRERARQSMANGARKGRSATSGVNRDRERRWRERRA